MEVAHYSYAYQHPVSMQEDVFYNQGSMSPPNEDATQTQYCSSYADPTDQLWPNKMHSFHALDCNMHWTQYSDINQQGVAVPRMSAHSYAIARRNERERNRVRHINSTFERLRKSLPSTGRKRKLSKVDTLRTAIKYIEHLQDVLDDTEPTQSAVKNSRLSNAPLSSEKINMQSENNNNNKSLLSVVSNLDDSSDSFLSCCRYSDNTPKGSSIENQQYILNKSGNIINNSDLNADSRTPSPQYSERTDEDPSWTDTVF